MDPVKSTEIFGNIWQKRMKLKTIVSASRYLDKHITYNSKQREKNFKNEEYSILVIIFNGI